MTPSARTRAILAAGAGAVVVAAAMSASDNDPAPRAAASVAQNRRAPNQTRGESGPVSELKLGLLRRSAPGMDEPARNPFRFQERLAEDPSRSSGAAGGPSRAVIPPPAAPAKPGPPALPSIPLRYIGLVDAPSQSGRVAILSDGRGNVFQSKEGDTIEGRYRVLKVGPDTVDLAHVDGRGQQTIRLSGQ